MEAVENNKNLGKPIFIAGFLLLLASIIFGPPTSFVMFPVAAIMILVGGRMKKKIAPPSKPLSQKSAKSKILAGIPAIALIYFSMVIEKYQALIGGAGLILLAYSFAGFVEAYLEKTHSNAKSGWDDMSSLKKFLISIFVIAIALIVFISLIPYGAKFVYR